MRNTWVPHGRHLGDRLAHRKPRVGEVLQFALPDGAFAYARTLRDSAIVFYRETSSEPGRPPIGSEEFQFGLAVYADVLRSDEVPIVGMDPKVYNGDDWPLPSAITDPLTGARSIYDHGEIRSATDAECEGLETAAVWDLHHVVDRLMGLGDIWTRGFPRGPAPEGH